MLCLFPLGNDHPDTLATVYYIAGLFESRGEYDKAFEWYRRAFDGVKALGKDHPYTIHADHYPLPCRLI